MATRKLLAPIVRMLGSALLAAALAASPQAAHAGDFARTEILGFSADGSHFAFEEYGIQDGSGFPYSNLYIIDTRRDRWVPGSPFRRLDEIDDSRSLDFAAELARTRAANRAAAQSLLDSTGIAGLGDTLAHNPATETLANPVRMEVTPRPEAPMSDDPVSLHLMQYPLASTAFCPHGMGETQGFRLTLTRAGLTRVLKSDNSLPESRGCPLRYRLERFLLHRARDDAPAHYAVIVLMERIGFEGPDGRYLAITGRF